MAALALTTPTRAGATVTPTGVGATDTVARALLPAMLRIDNGNAATDNMTISDASSTATGGAAAALAPSIPTTGKRAFKLHPEMCDPTTGVITITHSVQTSVNYELYPTPQ